MKSKSLTSIGGMISVISSSLALLMAFIIIPLTKTAPEAISLPIFIILWLGMFVFATIGVVSGLTNLATTRQPALIGILVGGLALVIELGITFIFLRPL